MDGYWWRLLLVVAMVLVNGILAGSEIALISLRQGQLRRLARHGGGGALVRLTADPTRYLATIQLGITLAGFLASATAAVALAEPLVAPLGFLGEAAEPVAVTAVTVVLTMVTLVVGELAPKRLALQRGEGWALLVARPLEALARAARPVVWLLGRSTDLLVRVAGGNPDGGAPEAGPEEVGELIATQSGFSPQQRRIIAGALRVRRLRLREVLVPRGRVVTVEATAPVARARAVLAAAGRSRAPVVSHGDLDRSVGVVHLRDLLEGTGTAAARAAPALLLPESLSVADALRRMQTDRQRFALVVEERGAVDGIVTIEDLLAEIMGELPDGTDQDPPTVRREPDGSLILPGTFPVHRLGELGVELGRSASGAYATVAGLVLARLGRLPAGPGETVPLPGWQVEVTAVARHAITEVRLRPEPRFHPEPRPDEQKGCDG